MCHASAVILVSCSCCRYPIVSLVSTFHTTISPCNELAAIYKPHSENLQMLSSCEEIGKQSVLYILDHYRTRENGIEPFGGLTVFKLVHFSLYNSFQDDLSTTTMSLLDGYARQLPSVHLKEGVQYDLAVKKELLFGTTLFQMCAVRFSLIFHTRIDPSALDDA